MDPRTRRAASTAQSKALSAGLGHMSHATVKTVPGGLLVSLRRSPKGKVSCRVLVSTEGGICTARIQ